MRQLIIFYLSFGKFFKTVSRSAFLLFCFLLTLSFFIGNDKAFARTDLFFLAPVSGELESEVSVPLILKGESLQTGAIDFLIDSRYISPVIINSNLIQVDRGVLANQGSPYFFAAAILDELFDETRSYLRTVRFSFAFQTPVTSNGAQELAVFHFNLIASPPTGITLLQVIKNTASMADLADYRQGGGAIFFVDGASTPEINIDSPINGQRYEENTVALNASLSGLSGNSTASVYWADPFEISEPIGNPIVTEGLESTADFEAGLHALVAMAIDSVGNADSAWTVFGVKEDVIVTVLGKIEATVVEHTSSEPVSGATVLLYEDDALITSCFTGTDGVCSFEGLEEGDYMVEAIKDYYESSSASVTVPENETVQVTLPILSLITPVDQVYEYATVKVCVYQNGDENNKVSDASVREIRGSYSCVTAEDGCCYIDRVRRDIDLYWYAENGELFSEITGPVRFNQSEEELEISVSSSFSTSIELNAVDPFNSYSGIYGIEAYLEDSSQNSMERVTDSSGIALFSPVSSSDYNIKVQTPLKTGPDNTSWQVEQTVEVSGSDVVEGKILPLTLPFAGLYADLETLSEAESPDPSQNPSLEIYVFDNNSNPLNSVQIDTQQTTGTGSFLTDGNGKVSIKNLNPGNATVSVSYAGYIGVRFDLTLAAGLSLKRYIKLGKTLSSLVEYKSISGESGDEDGSNCPAIEITVKNPITALPVTDLSAELTGKISGNVIKSGTLDANGSILAQNVDLDELPLELRLSREKIEGDETTNAWKELMILSPISAQENYLTSYTFYFVPESTDVSIESSAGSHPLLTSGLFILKDSNGSFISEAEVEVASIDDETTFNLTTDASGQADFQHDFPGKYHATVTKDGYIGVEFDLIMGLQSSYTINIAAYSVPLIFRPVYESCENGSLPDDSLKANLTLSVINSSTGQVLADLSTLLYDKDGNVISSGKTDSEGKWNLNDMTPSQGNRVEAYWDVSSGAWTEVQGVSCDLKADMETLVTLFANQDSSQLADSPFDDGDVQDGSSGISLKVVDRNGSPIYRVKMTLFDQNGRTLRSAYTNDQGIVEITSISTGLYSLTLEHQDSVVMNISSITVWPDISYEWQATLPETWDYMTGAVENASEGGRLEALVVNGETFKPLAGVPVEISPISGSSNLFLENVYSNTSGRLVVNGMDEAGPSMLTFKLNNYMELTEGPIHIKKAEVRYALYALTPENDVKRIGNADNVPSGKTFWFPENNKGIVHSNSGLTIFSYDYAQMSITKTAYVDLSSASSELIAASSIPLNISGSSMPFSGYILAVKSSSNQIKLLHYRPEANDSVEETALINTAGEVYDVMFGADKLLIASSQGLFFYGLTDETGDISPVLKSSIAIPSIKIVGSGKGVFAFSESGMIVGIDPSEWEMPVVTGLSSTGYMARDLVASPNYLFIADENDIIHTAKITGLQALGVDGADSVSSPSLWLSGQEQENLNNISTIKSITVQNRTFGYVLTETGVAVVEITDNVLLQTAFFPLPDSPEDIVFVRRRLDNSTSNTVLAITPSGFYTLPMPVETDSPVDVNINLTSFLPEGKGPWSVWTSRGFSQPLTTEETDGVTGFYWRAELPAGVYDISVVDEAGSSRFDYYSTSVFKNGTAEGSRLNASLDLQRADGSRAGSFMPGQDIFVNMGLDVWSPTVTDVYLMLIYQPDGSEEKLYCPVELNDGMVFEIKVCKENLSETTPFISSWSAVSFKDFRLRLLTLPDGDYGGAGMVSIIFARSGNDIENEENLFARVDTPIKIDQ